MSAKNEEKQSPVQFGLLTVFGLKLYYIFTYVSKGLELNAFCFMLISS